MEHDFKAFPELTNAQMAEFYFESPHRQITEDFTATVVKVHDGDTVTLRWSERDFVFPLRLSNIAAPELKQDKGLDSRLFLENLVVGRECDIIINPANRVEKWGRLLGELKVGGTDAGEELIMHGLAVPWEQRNDGLIPDFEKEMMTHE